MCSFKVFIAVQCQLSNHARAIARGGPAALSGVPMPFGPAALSGAPHAIWVLSGVLMPFGPAAMC